MKFTIDGKTLKTELDCVSRVINNKSTIPVLETVLIQARDGQVIFTGTDLDNFLIAPKPLDLTLGKFESGSLCVNARELSKMTGSMTGNVSFEIEDNRLQITCGKVKVRLAFVQAEHYPEIPQIKLTSQIAITGELLRSMVKNTGFAITKENSRLTLSAFKLIAEPGSAKIVTTDGHRLAYTAATKGFVCDAPIDVLISKDGLVEAAKLSNCVVAITHEKEHVRFVSNGRTLISRVPAGVFPNYEMVMPKENDKFAYFDITTMRDAVKRAQAVTDPRSDAMYVTFSKNNAEIESGTSEAMRSEGVEVEYTGKATKLGFNAKYLSEYLATAATGKGVLKFKDSNMQVEFSIDGYDYDYRYILMPLRIET